MLKHFKIAFLYAGAISMLVMSMHYFQHDITGIMKGKEISSNGLYRWCLRIHIAFGMIAIFTGPSQFIQSFRSKNLSLHRKLGYGYFFSILISGVAGLIIAQFALGGMVSTVGFSIQALLWLISGIAAIRYAKRKDFSLHKKWMMISYGLTFTAIPQRTMLLIPLFLNIEFLTIYKLSAWIPWILNISIALYLFNSAQNKIAS